MGQTATTTAKLGGPEPAHAESGNELFETPSPPARTPRGYGGTVRPTISTSSSTSPFASPRTWAFSLSIGF